MPNAGRALRSASPKCRGNIELFIRGLFPEEAGRRRCTVSALNVVGIKSERFISAPTWDALYIRIDRAPESHRECLRASQTSQNQKTWGMRTLDRVMAKKSKLDIAAVERAIQNARGEAELRVEEDHRMRKGRQQAPSLRVQIYQQACSPYRVNGRV